MLLARFSFEPFAKEKTMLVRLYVLAAVLALTASPAVADPWKDESGKGRDKIEKREEKRWEEHLKAREKDRERREKAWEQQRKAEEKYRDQQRRYPEQRYQQQRYRYYDDDDDFEEGYDVPRYESRRPVYQDDGYREWRPNRYQVPPPPQPYYDGRYQPSRGALKGSRIGSRIGDLIGGPEGARIGAEIGAEIGDEVDR
jgi:hypothetical protein